MRNNHAFTLIELLIVVAIIAILAGIGVSNFLEAQTRAKVAALKNDLRVVAGALEAYAVDNHKFPPSCGVGAAYNEFGNFAEPLSARLYAVTRAKAPAAPAIVRLTPAATGANRARGAGPGSRPSRRPIRGLAVAALIS